MIEREEETLREKNKKNNNNLLACTTCSGKKNVFVGGAGYRIDPSSFGCEMTA